MDVAPFYRASTLFAVAVKAVVAYPGLAGTRRPTATRRGGHARFACKEVLAHVRFACLRDRVTFGLRRLARAGAAGALEPPAQEWSHARARRRLGARHRPVGVRRRARETVEIVGAGGRRDGRCLGGRLALIRIERRVALLADERTSDPALSALPPTPKNCRTVGASRVLRAVQVRRARAVVELARFNVAHAVTLGVNLPAGRAPRGAAIHAYVAIPCTGGRVALWLARRIEAVLGQTPNLTEARAEVIATCGGVARGVTNLADEQLGRAPTAHALRQVLRCRSAGRNDDRVGTPWSVRRQRAQQ